MKRKWLAVFLATVLAMALLCGCGSNTAEKQENNTAGSAEDAGEAGTAETAETAENEGTTENEGTAENEGDAEETEEYTPVPAPDFTLKDQYGESHTLSDYKGKIVFLNFWATWCPPCRAEMPDIQGLYEETLQEEDPELVVLGVAFPGYGQEGSEAEIASFLEENGYTYPTVMDTDASLMLPYCITAYPTTFMIDKEGNVFGYVPGSMTREIMDQIIQQTKEGRRE